VWKIVFVKIFTTLYL